MEAMLEYDGTFNDNPILRIPWNSGRNKRGPAGRFLIIGCVFRGPFRVVVRGVLPPFGFRLRALLSEHKVRSLEGEL